MVNVFSNYHFCCLLFQLLKGHFFIIVGPVAVELERDVLGASRKVGNNRIVGERSFFLRGVILVSISAVLRAGRPQAKTFLPGLEVDSSTSPCHALLCPCQQVLLLRME